LINYPNTDVQLNIMNFPSPPSVKCFWTCRSIMYIMLRFSLDRIYSQFLCVNTFSFPLVCLTFSCSIWYKQN
jgi:hypothetical protein